MLENSWIMFYLKSECNGNTTIFAGMACLPDGGILMDGVIIRLAEDHFWFVQADGEFQVWLDAHASTFDVKIEDPKSHVLVTFKEIRAYGCHPWFQSK